jgi:hypothetical protein
MVFRYEMKNIKDFYAPYGAVGKRPAGSVQRGDIPGSGRLTIELLRQIISVQIITEPKKQCDDR